MPFYKENYTHIPLAEKFNKQKAISVVLQQRRKKAIPLKKATPLKKDVPVVL